MGSQNSVLQGYLSGLQLKQQKDQQAMRNQQIEDEHDMMQQQIDEEAKQHAAVNDLAQKKMDLDTAQAKINLEHIKNLAYGTPGQTPLSALPQPNVAANPANSNGMAAINNTVPQQDVSPQPYNLTPDQGYSGALQKLFPEGIKIDPNYIPRQLAMQSAQGDIEAQNEGKKAAAVSQAKLPDELAVQGEKNKATFTTSQARIQAAQIQAQARVAAANINASTKNKASEVDPDDISSAAQNLATGDVKMSDIPSKQKLPTLMALHNSGMVPLDPKTRDALKGANDIQSEFGEIEKLIPQLADSKLGVIGTTLGSHLPGSDLRNSVNQIGMRVGNVMRTVGGLQGQRFNQVEIQKTLDGIGNGTITKAQAIQNLQTLKSNMYQHINQSLLGGMPTGQKQMLMEKFTPKLGVKIQSPDGQETQYVDPALVPKAIQMGGKIVQ